MPTLTTTDLLKSAAAELSALRRQASIHHARAMSAAKAGGTVAVREGQVAAACIDQLADHAIGALCLARACKAHGDDAAYSDIHMRWMITTRSLLAQAREARAVTQPAAPAAAPKVAA